MLEEYDRAKFFNLVVIDVVYEFGAIYLKYQFWIFKTLTRKVVDIIG